MIFAFNATAYDAHPSGARNRAVGLAAALLRAGHSVRFYVPQSLSLRAAVAHEHGGEFAGDRFEQIATPLDPSSPLRRAAASRRWFERHLRADVDLFVTDYYPVLGGVPTALTVHDLRYIAAPQFEPAARAAWFRAYYPRMARRAPLVVVPTAAVARECAGLLGVEATRIAVVANGLMRTWREAPAAAGRGAHLLVVGFHERRKDLATVLAALRRAPAAGPLVVVGRGTPPRAARDLVAAGRVRFVGAVADAALVDLCRGAAALVHPSRYEGFGMSVVEAMSVGVPVLAARCAAVEEVAGGFATLLPPGDVDAWAAAMASPPALAPGARDHAHSSTWDACAKTLVEAAGCVASGP